MCDNIDEKRCSKPVAMTPVTVRKGSTASSSEDKMVAKVIVPVLEHDLATYVIAFIAAESERNRHGGNERQFFLD